ncbi:MAG: helix-turn-helix domain-containing protein [Trueperaceae bacterium]
MREWIPVPGSARARLLDAAAKIFERDGFEAASVTDIASEAGVTTGSLYHHFEGKLGLFQVVRQEMERRVRDRMEGAAAAAGGGWSGLVAALLVGFDAAVRFAAARILSDRQAAVTNDELRASVSALCEDAPQVAPGILLGAWRASLAAVADGAQPEDARAGLAWSLGKRP